MLPIDFPLVSLANVHPCYFTIRPEEVTVDLRITLESVTVCVSNDKQQRSSEGIALQLDKLVVDSTYTLMTKFVDCSLNTFTLLHLTSTDYLTSFEALSEGHAIITSPSPEPVFSVKSTTYQEKSVLAGRVVVHVNVAFLNMVVDNHLKAGMKLIGSLIEPVEEMMNTLQKRPSNSLSTSNVLQSYVGGSKEKVNTNTITHTPSTHPKTRNNSTNSSSSTTKPGTSLSPEQDIEIRVGCAGLDLLLRGEDDRHSLQLSLNTVDYTFNTKEHSQHEFVIHYVSIALNNHVFIQCGGLYEQHGVIVSITREKLIDVEIDNLQCSIEPSTQLEHLISLLEKV